MKYKKLMPVVFLLLAVLTIGAVSAFEDISVEDAYQDDMLAVEDAKEDLADNPVEEIIAIDDEGEILADDSLRLFQYDINVESEVDYGNENDNIVTILDVNSVNGTVTLSIDGKQYFNNEFDGSQAARTIYPSDLKDFNFEDYLGNHTVKVTYKNVTRESLVSFVFEPYFFHYYYAAIGDPTYIVFKATSASSGSVNLYHAVINNATCDYEESTFIGTYPINGSTSLVPLPILAEKGHHLFAVNYTINGKNSKKFFDVSAVENSKQITAGISDTEIRPGDNVTVEITTLKSGNVDIYVDGKYSDPAISMVNGTAQSTFSNLAVDQHCINIIYYDYKNIHEFYVKTFTVTVSNSTGNKIDMADVKLALSKTAFTYNAKVQKPTVTLTNGEVLKEGVDYTLKWSSASPKKAGSYYVVVTGIGAYKGTVKATFKINKAANPLKVKAKTAKIKFSTLKNKKQVLAVSKVIKFTKKGQGTLTYVKSTGNKKITINKKTGKVTVAKGLKKGTYKVKVKIKAKGNANYKASAYKAVTFKIIVK